MNIKLKEQTSSIDYPLLFFTIFLSLFGLVMVYDSSLVQALKDFNDSYYYIRQQIIWVIVGFISGGFFTFFDYHYFKKLAFLMLLASLILLVAVFIPGLGISGGGAHRWLNLRLAVIQPTEIIKLTGVIYLATIFEKGVRLKPFLILLTLVTFITAVLQKDLGSAVVFASVAGMIYFVSGGRWWHFLLLLPAGLLTAGALILTSSYRFQRVLAFLNPFSDTQGFTYHISQVLIALGSGGLMGVGLGQSRQKFAYIPEVTTDSIFAIVGEELGFLGSLVLIGVFLGLILRGFEIARHSGDNFGKILATGLTVWLGIQTVINLSSMVALVPLTGVPLPFISYGGSALVANLTAVGILLNISKDTKS